ncbi:MAG: helix-turn-helix domain-containing protein [Planctomycetota bacterium]|nr:helix-turn-helix domain-containing protein [Planctomycetota bacterium]
MSRRFRARTGGTLRDHLRILRLNRAVDLLAEGWSQAEVAVQLGYADAAAFNRRLCALGRSSAWTAPWLRVSLIVACLRAR